MAVPGYLPCLSRAQSAGSPCITARAFLYHRYTALFVAATLVVFADNSCRRFLDEEHVGYVFSWLPQAPVLMEPKERKTVCLSESFCCEISAAMFRSM